MPLWEPTHHADVLRGSRGLSAKMVDVWNCNLMQDHQPSFIASSLCYLCYLSMLRHSALDLLASSPAANMAVHSQLIVAPWQPSVCRELWRKSSMCMPDILPCVSRTCWTTGHCWVIMAIVIAAVGHLVCKAAMQLASLSNDCKSPTQEQLVWEH